MIERGYTNVRAVQGGGRAMEKIFDHYGATYYGGRIVNPRTGKVIEMKFKK
jgi:hypothetical protein